MTIKQRLTMIAVDELWQGANIRDDVGDIASLAESIGQIGVLEPIVVWPSEDRTHPEVGMGQRRLAAAKKAGLTEIPCILRGRPSERDRILMQLAENHERADMSAVDEAKAFRDLIRLGISRRAISHSLHKSEGWVYHRLKLLDMPHGIQDAVHAGTLTPSAALEFPLALAADTAAMARLAKIGHLDDRALRDWIRGEYQRRRRTTVKLERIGTRVVPVEIDAYELAKEHARKAGVTMGQWVTDAIHTKAKKRGAT